MAGVRTLDYRYGIVLLLILTTIAFQLAVPEGDAGRLIVVVLQALTLISAVIASGMPRWVEGLAAGVALVLIAGSAATLLGSERAELEAVHLISLLFATLAPVVIAIGVVRHLRAERAITMHTMFGVLCLYLLLGLFFAVSLQALQEVSNDSMLRPAADNADDFIYFSFMTITTTGFGDLVAATQVARSLTVTEMLIGQIYLVTVVGLIVGNLRPGARAKRA